MNPAGNGQRSCKCVCVCVCGGGVTSDLEATRVVSSNLVFSYF